MTNSRRITMESSSLLVATLQMEKSKEIAVRTCKYLLVRMEKHCGLVERILICHLSLLIKLIQLSSIKWGLFHLVGLKIGRKKERLIFMPTGIVFYRLAYIKLSIRVVTLLSPRCIIRATFKSSSVPLLPLILIITNRKPCSCTL